MMLPRLLVFVFAAKVASAYYKGSTTYNGSEYSYFCDGEDTVNWYTAQHLCLKKYTTFTNSQFATVHNPTLNGRITELLSLSYRYTVHPIAWLGAYYSMYEKNWTWIDGTPLDYDNWAPEEPRSQTCLDIDGNKGLWYTNSCRIAHGYMCQSELDQAVPSDFSDLAIHGLNEKLPRSFCEATKACKERGARLVKIPDERSKKAIMEKIAGTNYKYWVDMKKSGYQCWALSANGEEERDCDEVGLGYICETARPNMLRISDENPVIAEHANLQINCSASGFPVPYVTWRKKHGPPPEYSTIGGKGFATLVFNNASLNDAGEYVCIATNIIVEMENQNFGVSVLSVI